MNLTSRRIGFTALAAAVLLTLVWYAAVFRPQSAHLAKAHQAYATAHQQAASLQSKIVALKQLEKQIPADKARLQQLDAAVPAHADLQDLLNQLHLAASATGVELTTVGPASPYSGAPSSSPSSSTGPKSLSLTMTVTGLYPGLMAFVSDLDQMPRAVVVDSANVSTGGTPGDLTASLAARIFYTS